MSIVRQGGIYFVKRGAGAYPFPTFASALRFIQAQKEAAAARFVCYAMG